LKASAAKAAEAEAEQGGRVVILLFHLRSMLEQVGKLQVFVAVKILP
jgi:hypothetical protein